MSSSVKLHDPTLARAYLLALIRTPALRGRCRTLECVRNDAGVDEDTHARAVFDAIIPAVVAQLPLLVDLNFECGSAGDVKELLVSMAELRGLRVLRAAGPYESEDEARWRVEDALMATIDLPLESVMLYGVGLVDAPPTQALFGTTRTLKLGLDRLDSSEALVSTLSLFPALHFLELSISEEAIGAEAGLADLVDSGALRGVEHLMYESYTEHIHGVQPFTRRAPSQAGQLPSLRSLTWFQDPGRRWLDYKISSLSYLCLYNPRRSSAAALPVCLDVSFPSLRSLSVRPRHADRALFSETFGVRLPRIKSR